MTPATQRIVELKETIAADDACDDPASSGS